MDASVLSVNLAVLRKNPANSRMSTGIDKRPVDGSIRLHSLGVAGDSVCDTRHHGGIDQAVYAYALEDIQWWSAELAGEAAIVLGPGCLGENLTTVGLDISASIIGERWKIGSVLLEVSVPRIPCSTFAGFWQVDKLVKRFSAQGRPGAYLRVIHEGEARGGDGIEVVSRPDHGLSIRETFNAMLGEHSLAPKLLSAPQLPAKVLADAQRWLAAS